MSVVTLANLVLHPDEFVEWFRVCRRNTPPVPTRKAAFGADSHPFLSSESVFRPSVELPAEGRASGTRKRLFTQWGR